MKYILWPPIAIVLIVFLISVGTVKFVLLTLWHFRKTTVREAYTLDGMYLFEDFSWKGLAEEILVCPWGKDDEEELEEETE